MAGDGDRDTCRHLELRRWVASIDTATAAAVDIIRAGEQPNRHAIAVAHGITAYAAEWAVCEAYDLLAAEAAVRPPQVAKRAIAHAGEVERREGSNDQRASRRDTRKG